MQTVTINIIRKQHLNIDNLVIFKNPVNITVCNIVELNIYVTAVFYKKVNCNNE